jgi:hypothetical protein
LFLKKNILEILNKKLNKFENGARECKIIILILRFHAELTSFCILLASIDYFYNNFDNKNKFCLSACGIENLSNNGTLWINLSRA